MTAGTFHHFGVPTSKPSDDETYIEGAGVHVTDPTKHPFRIEFLRFDAGCEAMPEIVRTRSHAAFMVEDLDAALSGREVVVEPFDATETLKVAFIMDGDALIEVMQETKG
jgi:hypothetical protein